MAYIGKSPTAAPLTSSDVADGIITNAKLAQDIISADTALGAEPADTDELLVSDAGVLKRMDYSHIKASSGLAEADRWRLTANTTSNANITSNLERNDTTAFNHLGTGMSQSSGVFSFPSTGYWMVCVHLSSASGGGGGDDVQCNTAFTNNDGTNWYTFGIIENDMSDEMVQGLTSMAICDVTNTSNDKVIFNTDGMSDGGSVVHGSTGADVTYFTFIRLGDT